MLPPKTRAAEMATRTGRRAKAVLATRSRKENGPELRDGLDNTHHQAGGHDGGQDGDEHVAGGLENLFPQRHAGGRGGLDIGLGGRSRAGDGQELIVDLVDGAGADNELELSVGFKHALDAVNILQRFLVDLAVIRDKVGWRSAQR